MDWILLCGVKVSTGDWSSTIVRFKLSNEKESVLSSVTLKIPPRTTKEDSKTVWPQNSHPVWETPTTLNDVQFVYSRNTHKCVHQTIQKASSTFNHCQNPSNHVGIQSSQSDNILWITWWRTCVDVEGSKVIKWTILCAQLQPHVCSELAVTNENGP